MRTRPAIICLLSWSGPSTVARFIVAFPVWVTVKAMASRRFLAHVSKKILKRSQPAVGYLNAATPIKSKIFASRFACIAAAFHGLPRTIFRPAMIRFAGTQFTRYFNYSRNSRASATARFAAQKWLAVVDYFFDATITFTEPSIPAIFVFPNCAKDQQPSKSPAFQFLTFHGSAF